MKKTKRIEVRIPILVVLATNAAGRTIEEISLAAVKMVRKAVEKRLSKSKRFKPGLTLTGERTLGSIDLLANLPERRQRFALHVDRAGQDGQYAIGTVAALTSDTRSIEELEKALHELWSQWRAEVLASDDDCDSDSDFCTWLEQHGWKNVNSDHVVVLE